MTEDQDRFELAVLSAIAAGQPVTVGELARRDLPEALGWPRPGKPLARPEQAIVARLVKVLEAFLDREHPLVDFHPPSRALLQLALGQDVIEPVTWSLTDAGERELDRLRRA